MVFCMSLSFANIAQELRWLRPINLMAALSPMKLGACWILEMVFWKLFPGLHCFPYAITVHPPSEGGFFDSLPSRFLWLRLTDIVTTLSWRPSDELIWEDAERGLNVALLSCTAWHMPELTYKLKPSCLPESRDINSFGTFLRVMQWTSHCVSWQIDFVGVLFGLWPRFRCFWFLLFALLFPLAKRKSGWGICGSSCLVGFCGCVLF